MFYVSDEIVSKADETMEIDLSRLATEGRSANSSDAIEEFLSADHDHTKMVLFGKVIILKS